MHQRTLLSLISLPLVGALTYPAFVQNTPAPAKPKSDVASQDPLAGLADIQDVLRLVQDHYVDQPDVTQAIAGGIQGALERVHPLNSYLKPEDLHAPDPGPADAGMTVIKRMGLYAQILHVVPGSPAARAGLRAGDILRKIDGASLGATSSWALERSLRGKEGREMLVLRHDNVEGEPKTIKLKLEKPGSPAITLKTDERATMVTIPDLRTGRAGECFSLIDKLDRQTRLILDLRECAGGDYQEAAILAGCLGCSGVVGTRQESGKPDQPLHVVPGTMQPFKEVLVLVGIGTLGPAEVLGSALKKAGFTTLGERTLSLCVARTRFPLRQGGAVELVNQRWLGAGGEKLGTSGEKLDRSTGLMPKVTLRGLKPEDDVIAKVLSALQNAETKAAKQEIKGQQPPPPKKPDNAAPNKQSQREPLLFPQQDAVGMA